MHSHTDTDRDLKHTACLFVSHGPLTSLIQIIADCGLAQCWKLFQFTAFFIVGLKDYKNMLNLDGNGQTDR
jgi:hypothetical protein